MPSAQQTDRDSDVVSSSNQPNYAAIEIPTKPPTEYSYAERRAELLQQIQDLGHPSLINQTEEADRYGVSQQQISKDLDRIGEYVTETLGERRDLVTESVYHRSIQGLLEEGEYRKAAQTVTEWNEWLRERKDLEELRERFDRLEAQQERRQNR